MAEAIFQKPLNKRIKRLIDGLTYQAVKSGNNWILPSGTNAAAGEYITVDGVLGQATAAIVGGTDAIVENMNWALEGTGGALNSKATYSTNEQVIGTWITGDTLYRRVIPNLSVTDNYLYDLTAANIKEMIDVGGFVISPSADFFTLNTTDSSGTKAIAVYQPSSKQIRFWASAGTWDATLILTYTKNS